MDLDSIIFVDNLPKLDLHGFDRETARVIVLDFIKDNIKMKNEIINIVHGHGSGILKDTVHDTLRKNRNVIEFKTVSNNEAMTIVKRKI